MQLQAANQECKRELTPITKFTSSLSTAQASREQSFDNSSSATPSYFLPPLSDRVDLDSIKRGPRITYPSGPFLADHSPFRHTTPRCESNIPPEHTLCPVPLPPSGRQARHSMAGFHNRAPGSRSITSMSPFLFAYRRRASQYSSALIISLSTLCLLFATCGAIATAVAVCQSSYTKLSTGTPTIIAIVQFSCLVLFGIILI